MEPAEAAAIEALGALGQWTRLRIFRLLVARAPEALPAGAIAEAVDSLQNTLSFHLSALARAGLIVGVRDGRSILYRADLAGVRGLVSYLLMDCCNGRPEVCAPLLETMQQTCACTSPPTEASHVQE